jgi:hypothetical protein
MPDFLFSPLKEILVFCVAVAASAVVPKVVITPWVAKGPARSRLAAR